MTRSMLSERHCRRCHHGESIHRLVCLAHWCDCQELL